MARVHWLCAVSFFFFSKFLPSSAQPQVRVVKSSIHGEFYADFVLCAECEGKRAKRQSALDKINWASEISQRE